MSLNFGTFTLILNQNIEFKDLKISQNFSFFCIIKLVILYFIDLKCKRSITI